MADAQSQTGEIWITTNCWLMWGCSFWPAFTAQNTKLPPASRARKREGAFSEPRCPTKDFLTSPGPSGLTTSSPDPAAIPTNWLPFARYGTCGHCLMMLFSPDRDLTVDEQLVLFKGRCSFGQYIPKKPAKYGIKIWAAFDAKTSYAWRLQVCTGRAAGERAEVNQGMRVVLQMTEGLQGHVVTCDNFFT